LRSGLRGLAADGEGNLWAAATESGKLLKVDYRSGAVTEYAPPTEDSGPYSIDVDRKRNLIWFSEIYSDKIGRFDPASNTFVEFPHPIADSDVRRIEIDRSHPNRVWWASARGDKIGYIEAIE
jgi:streptogramin lyase